MRPAVDHEERCAAALADALRLEGALGLAVVDCCTRRTLASVGEDDGVDLDVAASANCAVVRAKQEAIVQTGRAEQVEDILITLEDHYQVIRAVSGDQEKCLYLVLDRHRANLALAGYALAELERRLTA